MEHYRCYRVFTNKTKAERVTDTIQFFPDKTSVPYMTTNDITIRAANNLIAAIKMLQPSTPLPQVGTTQLEALKQLAAIFKTQSNKPSTEKASTTVAFPDQTKEPSSTPATPPRVEEATPVALPRVEQATSEGGASPPTSLSNATRIIYQSCS